MGESMGKLFSGLTKTEVQNDGKSSLYNNPASAGMAIADAVRKTAEPATSNVQGELTPPAQGVSMLPGPVNASAPDVTPSGDNASVSMNQPAIAAPPMMKKTSFGEAASTSPNKLTTKGTVLRLLLESGLGAAAGAGSRTVGEGSARALQAQKARSDLVTQGNEQEQQRANLADLPGDKARAVAHTEAVTALAKAQTDSLKPVMVNGLPVAQKQLGTVATAQINNKAKEEARDPLVDNYNQLVQDLIAKGEDPTKNQVAQQWASAITAKKSGKQPSSNDRAIAIYAIPPAERSPEDKSFIAGYEKNVDVTKTQPGVARMREAGSMRQYPVAIDGVPGLMNSNRLNTLPYGEAIPAQYSPETVAAAAAGKSLVPTHLGDQVNSYNQLAKHVGSMLDLVSSLKNSNTPWLNKPINQLRKDAEGNPDIARFLVAMEAPRKEYASFLLNNRALYEDDRKAGQNMLNENMSPNQIFSSGGQMLHTATQRMQSSNAGYKRVSGGSDIPNLVEPQALDVLMKYGNKGDVPAGGKISVTDPNGGVHTFPDQKSANAFKKAAGIK